MFTIMFILGSILSSIGGIFMVPINVFIYLWNFCWTFIALLFN